LRAAATRCGVLALLALSLRRRASSARVNDPDANIWPCGPVTSFSRSAPAVRSTRRKCQEYVSSPCASGNDARVDAERDLLCGVERRRDRDEQRVRAVGGGDGVRGRGGAGDRRAEAAVRVAALPLVGERRRRLVPAAAGDLERLTHTGRAADR